MRVELDVPDTPIVLYIEGDGIGIDITPVMLKVVDKAVDLAYQGKRKIIWTEIFAGEKACRVYGQDQWLPEETLRLLKQYHVGIKRSPDNTCLWRYTLFERSAATTVRFVCLPPSRSLLSWHT